MCTFSQFSQDLHKTHADLAGQFKFRCQQEDHKISGKDKHIKMCNITVCLYLYILRVLSLKCSFCKEPYL